MTKPSKQESYRRTTTPSLTIFLDWRKKNPACATATRPSPQLCSASSPPIANRAERLLISGSYLGSDMSTSQGNREFTEKVLKYGFQRSMDDNRSKVINGLGRTLTIPRLPNEAKLSRYSSRVHCSRSSRLFGICLCPRQSKCRYCLQRQLPYLRSGLSFRKYRVGERALKR